MKTKIIWSIVFLLACVLSGTAGAYVAIVVRGRGTEGNVLRARSLELTDANKSVRAVFSVGDDGSVSLRMLSRGNVPVVELGVNGDPGPYKLYTPSGSLVIRDGASTPVVRLRAFDKGEGELSFSSTQTEDRVVVGYMPYGDVVDQHNPAIWGIAVRGPNHETTGIGVRTEDDVAQGFVGPRKTGPDKLHGGERGQ